jgi:hypothetical protein
MFLVEQEPAAGWHRDPDDAATFRYWNGREWTVRAQTSTDVRGFRHRTAQWKRRRVLDSWLFQNPVAHVLAWFDCSVPFTRGRLRKFATPKELRTLDQVWGPETRP